MKKNVLIITDVDFWEKGAGHRMRITELVKYLSAKTNLYVVYIGIAPFADTEFIQKEYNCRLAILCRERILEIEEYGELLSVYANLHKFDTCIIEFIHNTYYLQFIAEGTTTILDTHDLFSTKAKEFAAFGYREYTMEISMEMELEIFAVYDYIMIIDQPDFGVLSNYLPPDKLLLCPHPATIYPRKLRDVVQEIVFVGSEYLPNKDAIEYFIEECWPQLSSNYNVCLSIYGRVCNQLDLKKLQPKVFLKGYVHDLRLIYDHADIIINPIRFGSGIKIKNIEALAHGLPLVTTHHGARGIEKGIGSAFLVAGSSSQFVDRITELIKNSDAIKKLNRGAIDFALNNFSADNCFKHLISAIRES